MSVFPVPSPRRTLSSAALLCLSTGLLWPARAQAQFVTNSPDPFQGSMLTLKAPAPEPYPPIGYGQTFFVTNIMETNNTVSNGNDVINYNAVLDATFYTAPDLSTARAHILLPGSFQVTLFDRSDPFATGTFAYQIDSIDFSGTINGHTLTTQLNPAFVSMGTTTITPGPEVGQYTITAPAVLYGERSIDGGPAVAGPPFIVTVGSVPTAVPEPGLAPMTALLGLSGLLTWRRVKNRN